MIRFGRAKLLLSPSSPRLAGRLALPWENRTGGRGRYIIKVVSNRIAGRNRSREQSRGIAGKGPCNDCTALTRIRRDWNHGRATRCPETEEAGKAEGQALGEGAKERRRNSKDPTVRFQGAEKWPVVQAFAGSKLWQDGMGYLTIARQEGEGRLVYGVYLVDVYCLGVKNAFWDAGSLADFKEMLQKMENTQDMVPIEPACLVKTIQGAVEYAASFDFPPHPDYRHAAKLLAGIDPSACDQEFRFGKDGKPFYIQGPYESPATAEAIKQRVEDAGGHFIMPLPGFGEDEFDDLDDAQFDSDAFEDEDAAGE